MDSLPRTPGVNKPPYDNSPTAVQQRVDLAIADATRQLRGAPCVPIDPALPSDAWWLEIRRRVAQADAAGHFGSIKTTPTTGMEAAK